MRASRHRRGLVGNVSSKQELGEPGMAAWGSLFIEPERLLGFWAVPGLI